MSAVLAVPAAQGAFASHGFAMLPALWPVRECERLASHLADLAEGAGGTRSLLSQPWCAEMARQLRWHPALQPLLPAGAVAVQCTHFEKSADRNWLVALHQDLSIPVAARVDSPGLRGWSHKEGVWFVQPPLAVLQQLVAVRLHLDACGPTDGPLRVVPSSHQHGLLAPDEATALREAQGEVACAAAAGDALVMRPLLLHASSKSSGTSRRRVLHLLFGPLALPLGLQWHQAI